MQAEFIRLGSAEMEKYINYTTLYLPSEVVISKTREFQDRILDGSANPLRTFNTAQLRAEFMLMSTNDKEDYLAHRMVTLPSQAGNMFGDEDRQDQSLIQRSSTIRDPNTQQDLPPPNRRSKVTLSTIQTISTIQTTSMITTSMIRLV
jgi:hypothetical protein